MTNPPVVKLTVAQLVEFAKTETKRSRSPSSAYMDVISILHQKGFTHKQIVAWLEEKKIFVTRYRVAHLLKKAKP